MCTLSIIPQAGATAQVCERAFRVVCNRDENRGRADAAPPRWREVNGCRAIWPADGKAGGTWIAANEHGLVLCLLNVNPRTRGTVTEPVASRGKVIPRLVDAESVRGAIDRLSTEALAGFSPFRLVAAGFAAGGLEIAEAVWNPGARRALRTRACGPAPCCFVSSGLGDHRVRPRLDLFRHMLSGADTSAEPPSSAELRRAQDLFHAHVWPDKPHLSVMMSRDDARTVSVTDVEVQLDARSGRTGVRMHYRPVVQTASVGTRATSARR